MMIVALTLFMHIMERHGCLFISLVVVPSAESFALITINSTRGEEIWGRELMETTPPWLRASGGALSLWFMEGCRRAPCWCCQRQILDSNQNSKRERKGKGRGKKKRKQTTGCTWLQPGAGAGEMWWSPDSLGSVSGCPQEANGTQKQS